jgi:hypothetical protein
MMNLEILMRKALNPKYSPEERARAFDKLYYDYIKINGSDKGWDKFRENLRKKFSNFLSEKQKLKFGLTKKGKNIALNELKKFVSAKKKSKYPVEIFYRTSFALIKKIAPKNARILDVGYGDYPTFIRFLNSRGYESYGIEPFPKEFDNKNSFKGTIKDFPKELNKKYDLILINMVYTINYTHYFPKKFKWELKNKEKLIKKLNLLLDKKGYLVLIDDIGTIFTKRDLKKYFKILLFEKDNEGRITLLRKKLKVSQ